MRRRTERRRKHRKYQRAQERQNVILALLLVPLSVFSLYAYLQLHGPAWAWWGGGAANLVLTGVQLYRMRDGA